MAYSIKDVDAVEAAFRRIRPTAVLERTDFDFGLYVKDGDNVYILFSPSERIQTTIEEAECLAFFMGSQWTPEEILRIANKAQQWAAGNPINRIH